MKATGIVRRIDDLGRVVIPKEIRRTMRIREGDPLEIYTANDGEVIFKKYSPMGEMSAVAADICTALSQGVKLCVAICDRDRVIAAAGSCKKELSEQPITEELSELTEQRKLYTAGDESLFAVQSCTRRLCAMCPIISAGDIIGSVVLLESDASKKADQTDTALIQVAAQFLGSRSE